MSPTVNKDGSIGSDVRVKAKRPNMLNVVRGLSTLGWGQKSSRSRSSSFSVIRMARKTVIGGSTDGYCYGVHAMDESGSLTKENAERRIFCCSSLKSGSGVEVVT